MSKEILVLLGFLFLIILSLGNVSAQDDWCVVAATSADCETTLLGGVVMSISDVTNAHGALAGQGSFAPVLCCTFGNEATSCPDVNKILRLSSSTNAHAEAPNLASPNYNIGVCYDGLKDCSSIDAGFNCAVDEIELVYLSSGEAQSYTNAHIEGAGLSPQNYNSKICCGIDYAALCDLTTAEWQDEEVMEGADVETIVNGTYCSEIEISFEVFRGTTSCNSIDGCTNPPNVFFGLGSTSVSGTWNAGPIHDNEYRFVATVVNNPSKTVPSRTPDLLVNELICGPIVICSQYESESDCDSNICEIDVQDSIPSDDVDCSDPDINCECIWEDNECKAGWEPPLDSHTECIDNMCVKVNGVGVSECSPVGSSCNIIDPNHNVCLGPACVLELGEGEDQCTGPEQCVGEPEWHSICDDNACVQVEGPGVIACLPIGPESSGCPTPPETYSICVGQMCALKVGSGESQCEKSVDCAEDGLSVGICIYTQFTDDTCDDEGFLTFSWTGEWIWDAGCDLPSGCQTQADNLALQAQCEEGGEKTVECPAQIPLPFFNIYSFVAALTIIALIYVILILRKEKRKR